MDVRRPKHPAYKRYVLGQFKMNMAAFEITYKDGGTVCGFPVSRKHTSLMYNSDTKLIRVLYAYSENYPGRSSLRARHTSQFVSFEGFATCPQVN